MISVIIPTFNRFEILKETIQKTLDISSEIDFEIIVVNDGEELPFHFNHPKLRILKNPARGAAGARNYGAECAKYSILFFIDDDMWITRESLNGISELNQDSFFTSNCAVLNWQYPIQLIHELKINKIGRYLLRSGYHTLEGRLHGKVDDKTSLMKIELAGSGSFVIGKDVFYKIGKYNEAFIFMGEDQYLSQSLHDAGIELFLYTKITCFHNQKDRLNIEGFLDREWRGYASLFNNKSFAGRPNIIKQLLYTPLIPFYGILLILFKWIPNKSFFDFITFRTIGILSSVIYFKAWYAAGKK